MLNLIKLRDKYNLTQQDMASILNIDRSLYGKYEREYIIIPINHLITICEHFDVSVDSVFGFKTKNCTLNKADKIKAGCNLKKWRKENKLTQDKLASVLNTNRSVIANYERGRTFIATPFLYTICKKYEVSADYLLGKID